MAGAVRRPFVTRLPFASRSPGAAWVAMLLVLPALLAAGPLRAAAPAALGCDNVTQDNVTQSEIVAGTTPILFVHGINSDPTTWTTGTVSGTSQAPLNYIESALGTSQVTGYTFNWSKYSGFQYGSKLSWVTGPPAPGPGQLLAQAIRCVAGKAGHKVIIIAHSMGGLVTDYASSAGSVSSDIAAVFTLGTPFQGSWLDSTAAGPLGWLSQAIGAYCSFGGSPSSPGTGGQGAKQHVKPPGAIEAPCHIVSERDDPGMKGMRTDIGKKEGWHALNWPGSFPVFPLAASIQATSWQPLPLFGPQLTFADFGDFVVGTSSELDGGTTPTVTCTVPIAGALALPTLLDAVAASSCFHTNEPDNRTLLDSIISTITQRHLIPAAAPSTSPAPCTQSAMTSAVAPAMNAPQQGGEKWNVTQYACKDGYALARISVSHGLGLVAVLKQQGSSWKLVYGPNEGLCIEPVDLQFCPNHTLPLPLPVLNALEAAIMTQEPAPTSAPPPPTSTPPSPTSTPPPPTSTLPSPTSAPPTPGSTLPSPTSTPPTPGSTLPAWAGNLGPGVTVEPPSAGMGSNTVYGYMNNLHPQDSPAPCQYIVPSSQSACQSVLNNAAQNGTFVEVTYQSMGTEYAAIDGDKALVVLDYAQLCLWVGIQENCLPDNNDPAALLDSGQSFNALWTEATSGSNNEIELIPLLKVNGTWYVDYSQFPYPRYS